VGGGAGVMVGQSLRQLLLLCHTHDIFPDPIFPRDMPTKTETASTQPSGNTVERQYLDKSISEI
jgi:hypothetical protein